MEISLIATVELDRPDLIPFQGLMQGSIYNTFTFSCFLFYQVIFEIVLVSPQVKGHKEGRTEVKIKMRHLVTDHIWMWSRNKFLDRKDHMQDMYQNYVEGEEWQQPQVSHMTVT